MAWSPQPVASVSSAGPKLGGGPLRAREIRDLDAGEDLCLVFVRLDAVDPLLEKLFRFPRPVHASGVEDDP